MADQQLGNNNYYSYNITKILKANFGKKDFIYKEAYDRKPLGRDKVVYRINLKMPMAEFRDAAPELRASMNKVLKVLKDNFQYLDQDVRKAEYEVMIRIEHNPKYQRLNPYAWIASIFRFTENGNIKFELEPLTGEDDSDGFPTML